MNIDGRHVRAGFGRALPLGLLVVLLAGTLPAQEPAAASASGSWTMHRRDLLNTGVSDSKKDSTGKPKWKFLASNRITQSPVVKDGRLFVGDASSIFYCIDVQTGALVWNSEPRARLGGEVTAPAPGGALATATGQEYMFSSPCIADDVVVTVTKQGIMTAFRCTDGAIAWERDFDTEVFSSLKFADGKILFGATDRKFRALDPATGKDVWTYECGDIVGSTCAVLERSGTVIFPAHDKYLHQLDLATGAVKRRHLIGYRSTGTPLIAFGCAFMCGTGRRYMCIDLISGETRWYRDSVSQHQQGVARVGDATIVQIGRIVFSYNAIDGRENWKYQMPGAGGVSPCVGPELLYMSDVKGTVMAFDPATGAVRWQGGVNEGSWSSPILVDGILYVCDGTGYVHAFE